LEAPVKIIIYFNTKETEMGIDKLGVIPIYHQLAEILRENILQGKMNMDNPIPSETELAEKYQISRGTVRQALQLLTQEKLIERFPGRGSFVAQPRLEHDVSKAIGFFSQIAMDAGRRPAAKIISQEITKAPEIVAQKLHIKPGDEILHVKRIRYVDDEPWATESTYFSNPVRDLLKNEDLTQSIYGLLQDKFELSISHSHNLISSTTADENFSDLLRISLGDAVFAVERTVYLNNNLPFEFATDVYRGDRITLKLDMSYQKKLSNINIEINS